MIVWFVWRQDLCHLHSDRSLIQQKTAAIVNCFIDSPIPPSLQVDITQDMADRIVSRKMESSPYLFREAQVGVLAISLSSAQLDPVKLGLYICTLRYLIHGSGVWERFAK